MPSATALRSALLFIGYDCNIKFSDDYIEMKITLDNVEVGIKKTFDSLVTRKSGDRLWNHLILEPVGMLHSVDDVINNMQTKLNWYEYEIPSAYHTGMLHSLFPKAKFLVAEAVASFTDIVASMMSQFNYGGSWMLTPATLSTIRLVFLSITNE